MNPITGKRLVRTWPSAALQRQTVAWYRQAEQLLGSSFLMQRCLLRFLNSDFEQAAFDRKRYQPDYTEFLSQVIQTGQYSQWIQSDAVGFEYELVYQVLIFVFLAVVREYLMNCQAFLPVEILDKFHITVEGISVQGLNV